MQHQGNLLNPRARARTAIGLVALCTACGGQAEAPREPARTVPTPSSTATTTLAAQASAAPEAAPERPRGCSEATGDAALTLLGSTPPIAASWRLPSALVVMTGDANWVDDERTGKSHRVSRYEGHVVDATGVRSKPALIRGIEPELIETLSGSQPDDLYAGVRRYGPHATTTTVGYRFRGKGWTLDPLAGAYGTLEVPFVRGEWSGSTRTIGELPGGGFAVLNGQEIIISRAARRIVARPASPPADCEPRYKAAEVLAGQLYAIVEGCRKDYLVHWPAIERSPESVELPTFLDSPQLARTRAGTVFAVGRNAIVRFRNSSVEQVEANLGMPKKYPPYFDLKVEVASFGEDAVAVAVIASGWYQAVVFVDGAGDARRIELPRSLDLGVDSTGATWLARKRPGELAPGVSDQICRVAPGASEAIEAALPNAAAWMGHAPLRRFSDGTVILQAATREAALFYTTSRPQAAPAPGAPK